MLCLDKKGAVAKLALFSEAVHPSENGGKVLRVMKSELRKTWHPE